MQSLFTPCMCIQWYRIATATISLIPRRHRAPGNEAAATIYFVWTIPFLCHSSTAVSRVTRVEHFEGPLYGVDWALMVGGADSWDTDSWTSILSGVDRVQISAGHWPFSAQFSINLIFSLLDSCSYINLDTDRAKKVVEFKIFSKHATGKELEERELRYELLSSILQQQSKANKVFKQLHYWQCKTCDLIGSYQSSCIPRNTDSYINSLLSNI